MVEIYLRPALAGDGGHVGQIAGEVPNHVKGPDEIWK